MLIFRAIAAAHHKRLNRKRGVFAHWEGLRLTRTELIEGYKRKARRHPVTGLAAHVEQCNELVSVVVEGPDTSIVKNFESTRLATVLSGGKAVPRAHEFVAALNLASQRT